MHMAHGWLEGVNLKVGSTRHLIGRTIMQIGLFGLREC